MVKWTWPGEGGKGLLRDRAGGSQQSVEEAELALKWAGPGTDVKGSKDNTKQNQQMYIFKNSDSVER
jgi:hypothetical protein